jgi:hypothetical protein
VLHQWIDGSFVSGYNPWPEWVDDMRIDQSAGMDWETLKDHMRGTMK